MHVLQAEAVANLSAALEKGVFTEVAKPSVQRLLYYVEKRRADPDWYLRLLGTLHDKTVESKLFKRDYVYTKPQTQKKLRRLEAEANKH